MGENGISFTNAIVRTPCPRVCEGITSVDIGKPDFHTAVFQHLQYISALERCGLTVTIMQSDNDFPDSTFVEDVAVLSEKCAIVTNPGAPTRKGEEKQVEKLLRTRFYRTENVEKIQAPGTLEGGDILRYRDHFYIGLSNRTNEEGAKQLMSILKKYGYTSSVVKLGKLLHLKSGIAYLGKDTFAAVEELAANPEFEGKKIVLIPAEEGYAANVLSVNGHVLVPTGFPHSREAICKAGFDVVPVDTKEFRKIDGGLSCLSLRFRI